MNTQQSTYRTSLFLIAGSVTRPLFELALSLVCVSCLQPERRERMFMYTESRTVRITIELINRNYHIQGHDNIALPRNAMIHSITFEKQVDSSLDRCAHVQHLLCGQSRIKHGLVFIIQHDRDLVEGTLALKNIYGNRNLAHTTKSRVQDILLVACIRSVTSSNLPLGGSASLIESFLGSSPRGHAQKAIMFAREK